MCAAARSAKAAILLFTALVVVVLSGCEDEAKPSTPWGQLSREKVVYVVTTEDPADLEPYRIRSGSRRVEILPVSMISLRIKEIGKSPVIFLINRGKRLRCGSDDEMLLPYATSAIKPNMVLTYMSKDRKRDPRREGAWDVLISAPSKKWLFKALDEFISSSSVPATPVIREIASVAVIATDGRELASRWVRAVEQSADWDFYSAKQLDGSVNFDGFDEIYLINRDELPDVPDKLLARLPRGIRENLPASCAATDILIEKEMKSEDGGRAWKAAIIAPNREFLESRISRFDRMDKIPEVLSKESLKDLTAFTSTAIVARPADRARKDLAPYVDEIASRLTSALTRSTRFRCANRQDMKEAIYEALQTGQAVELDASKAQDLGSVVKSHVLLVADLLDVSTMSTFKAKDPVQVSQGYGSFSEPEPSQPSKPDLDDRRYGLFGPKKYQDSSDPDYREDMHEWREDMEKWERMHREWETRRWQHNQKVAQHDMEWTVGCNVTESASVNANIRLYSLEQAPGYAPGVVVYSCSVSGTGEKTRLFKEDRVVVRGEGRRPGTIVVPPSDSQISDRSVIAEAIDKAVAQFVVNLHTSAVLPGELVNWKPAFAELPTEEGKTPEAGDIRRTEAVKTFENAAFTAYEETGSFDCLKAPKPGTQTEDVKKQAVESACRKLLTSLQMFHAGEDISLQTLVGKSQVLSAGWDPATKQYRVKIRFELPDKRSAQKT